MKEKSIVLPGSLDTGGSGTKKSDPIDQTQERAQDNMRVRSWSGSTREELAIQLGAIQDGRRRMRA